MDATSIVLAAVIAALVYCSVQFYQWWRDFRRVAEQVEKFPGLPRSLLSGNLSQVRQLRLKSYFIPSCFRNRGSGTAAEIEIVILKYNPVFMIFGGSGTAAEIEIVILKYLQKIRL